MQGGTRLLNSTAIATALVEGSAAVGVATQHKRPLNIEVQRGRNRSSMGTCEETKATRNSSVPASAGLCQTQQRPSTEARYRKRNIKALLGATDTLRRQYQAFDVFNEPQATPQSLVAAFNAVTDGSPKRRGKGLRISRGSVDPARKQAANLRARNHSARSSLSQAVRTSLSQRSLIYDCPLQRPSDSSARPAHPKSQLGRRLENKRQLLKFRKAKRQSNLPEASFEVCKSQGSSKEDLEQPQQDQGSTGLQNKVSPSKRDSPNSRRLGAQKKSFQIQLCDHLERKRAGMSPGGTSKTPTTADTKAIHRKELGGFGSGLTGSAGKTQHQAQQVYGATSSAQLDKVVPPSDSHLSAPGHLIDGLKQDVEQLERENKRIQAKTKLTQNRISDKSKKHWNHIVHTQRAKTDKIELMRDLCTYQANFSLKNGEQVGLALASLNKRITATQRTLKANWSPSKQSGWITDSNKDELISLLSRVSNFDQTEPQNHGFSMGTAALLRSSFTSGAEKKATIERITKGGLFSLIRQRQNQFSGIRIISGVTCRVKAERLNSYVVGVISCARSNKAFPFEFKQLSRSHFSIQEELLRIYFQNSRSGHTHRTAMQLSVVPESEWPKEPVSSEESLGVLRYYAKLKGLQSEYASMLVERQKIKTTHTDTNVQVSIHLLDGSCLSTLIKEEEPKLSLLKIAQRCEKEFVVCQHGLTGVFQLVRVQDALGSHFQQLINQQKEFSALHQESHPLEPKKNAIGISSPTPQTKEVESELNFCNPNQNEVKTCYELNTRQQTSQQLRKADYVKNRRATKSNIDELQARDDKTTEFLLQKQGSFLNLNQQLIVEKLTLMEVIETQDTRSRQKWFEYGASQQVQLSSRPLFEGSSDASIFNDIKFTQKKLERLISGVSQTGTEVIANYSKQQSESLNEKVLQIKPTRCEASDQISQDIISSDTSEMKSDPMHRKSACGAKQSEFVHIDVNQLNLEFHEFLYTYRLSQSFRYFTKLTLRRERESETQQFCEADVQYLVHSLLFDYEIEPEMTDKVIQNPLSNQNLPFVTVLYHQVPKKEIKRLFQEGRVVAEEIFSIDSDNQKLHPEAKSEQKKPPIRASSEGVQFTVNLLFYLDRTSKLNMFLGVARKRSDSEADVMMGSESSDNSSERQFVSSEQQLDSGLHQLGSPPPGSYDNSAATHMLSFAGDSSACASTTRGDKTSKSTGYTVNVRIESGFMHFLDDPNIVEPSDVVKNMELLTQNANLLARIVRPQIPHTQSFPAANIQSPPQGRPTLNGGDAKFQSGTGPPQTMPRRIETTPSRKIVEEDNESDKTSLQNPSPKLQQGKNPCFRFLRGETDEHKLCGPHRRSSSQLQIRSEPCSGWTAQPNKDDTLLQKPKGNEKYSQYSQILNCI